jgi:hypothetical protein
VQFGGDRVEFVDRRVGEGEEAVVDRSEGGASIRGVEQLAHQLRMIAGGGRAGGGGCVVHALIISNPLALSRRFDTFFCNYFLVAHATFPPAMVAKGMVERSGIVIGVHHADRAAFVIIIVEADRIVDMMQGAERVREHAHRQRIA